MIYPRKICHSNRGMDLENDINLTNNYYLEKEQQILKKYYLSKE